MTHEAAGAVEFGCIQVGLGVCDTTRNVPEFPSIKTTGRPERRGFGFGGWTQNFTNAHGRLPHSKALCAASAVAIPFQPICVAALHTLGTEVWPRDAQPRTSCFVLLEDSLWCGPGAKMCFSDQLFCSRRFWVSTRGNRYLRLLSHVGMHVCLTRCMGFKDQFELFWNVARGSIDMLPALWVRVMSHHMHRVYRLGQELPCELRRAQCEAFDTADMATTILDLNMRLASDKVWLSNRYTI